jgi:hypothetical protein
MDIEQRLALLEKRIQATQTIAGAALGFAMMAIGLAFAF